MVTKPPKTQREQLVSNELCQLSNIMYIFVHTLIFTDDVLLYKVKLCLLFLISKQEALNVFLLYLSLNQRPKVRSLRLKLKK